MQVRGLLLTNDLMFSSRVTSAARQRDMTVTVAKTPEAVVDLADVSLVMLDLQLVPPAQLGALVETVMSSAPKARIVAYYRLVRAIQAEAGTSPETRPQHQGTLEQGPLLLNLQTHWLFINGEPVELTPREFDLLHLFMRNPRQVLVRERILEAVWGYDFGGEDNVLEVYIGYLRKKTEAAGEPRLIQTIRGVGYALREE